jgi:hypothetical protein
MKTNLTKSQVLGIVIAVIGSYLVANYDSLIPYRFKEFTSQQGKFSVLMPGLPSSNDTEIGKDGQKQTIHSFTTQPRPHLVFSCAYIDLASAVPDLQIETLLDNARDGAIKNVQGTFVKELRLKVHGFPSRQFQAETRGGGYMDAKIVLVENKFYMLMVVNTKGIRARDEAEVERFFSSFKTLVKT